MVSRPTGLRLCILLTRLATGSASEIHLFGFAGVVLRVSVLYLIDALRYGGMFYLLTSAMRGSSVVCLYVSYLYWACYAMTRGTRRTRRRGGCFNIRSHLYIRLCFRTFFLLLASMAWPLLFC
ncbi:hypothetical protein K402DRAFT_272572 [Aulographum hederae CBS 113979]|uniref:Uncharacterized protein n=1 Tax=Aulographum hederae CBS 113979 TaxID=1176131 RepID=A0A6G1H8Q0_9PEZI|nr:hypothetical protein K402DRAFT_272572 [Aulographum hederae CBS 113979]